MVINTREATPTLQIMRGVVAGSRLPTHGQGVFSIS